MKSRRRSAHPFCKFLVRSLKRFFSNSTKSVPQQVAAHGANSFMELPPELQLCVLSYLPPDSLIAAKCVCRLWRHLVLEYPTALQAFPTQFTLRFRANGQLEMLLQVALFDGKSHCEVLRWPKLRGKLSDVNFSNTFLIHCQAESIVLDGSSGGEMADTNDRLCAILDEAMVPHAVSLLCRTHFTQRLRSFTMINWTVDDDRNFTVMKLLAATHGDSVDRPSSLHSAFDFLTTLLQSKVQNLQLECNIPEAENIPNTFLESLFSSTFLGSHRKIRIGTIPMNCEMISRLVETISTQRNPSVFGRIMLRTTGAHELLSTFGTLPRKILNCHNKHFFVEISMLNESTVQLWTGLEICTGEPLSLTISSYFNSSSVFAASTKMRLRIVSHCSSCIAVNVRTSNPHCRVQPNFLIMFDKADLLLSSHRIGDDETVVIFECFPFVCTPNVHFDPAWFNPSATYRELRVPLRLFDPPKFTFSALL